MLVGGLILFSVAASYLLWTYARTIRLRNDMEALRALLFDEALKLNALQDESVQRSLRSLDAVADCADAISIPLMVSIVMRDDPRTGLFAQPEPRHEVASLLLGVRHAAANRLFKYLFRETAIGVTIGVLSGLAVMSNWQTRVVRRLQDCFTRDDTFARA